MRYGFKAGSERVALSLRGQINLAPTDALEPLAFLREQGIIVWTPYEIPGLGKGALDQLTSIDPDSWSGLTIREAGSTAIVINPTHPTGRQANTLMHEWAHLHLKHEPKRVDLTPEGVILISDYAKEDEEEADWLAGAVLVPRDGLMTLARRGLDDVAIADTYGVSVDLARWRIRMTGVAKQIRLAR